MKENMNVVVINQTFYAKNKDQKTILLQTIFK